MALRQIYVPLVLTPEPIADTAPEHQVHAGGRLAADWLEDGFRFAHGDGTLPLPGMGVPSTLFVAGEAGSGKTTLTAQIVTSLAGTIPDDFNQRFHGVLPFPFFLRDVPIANIGSLGDLLGWWLQQAKEAEPGLEIEHVLAFLDKGYGILILDGLDEVGSVDRRRKVAGWLQDHHWVNGGPPGNLTVVTARPAGFEGLKVEAGNETLKRLHVAPFSSTQIEAFLAKWFELRPLPPTRRKEQAGELVKRLLEDDRMKSLRALSRRPAYLTSLAFVHHTRGALPHTRAALYESLVDAYIDVLDRQRGILRQNWDRQEKREVLAAVAYRAHEGATTRAGDSDDDRRYTWSQQELVAEVAAAIEKGKTRFRSIRQEDAKELTSYYLARTGLIVESSEGRFQFGHLSFQEYLAALYALDKASGARDKALALDSLLLKKLEKPGWEEVSLLALATDAARTQGAGHRAALARLNPTNRAHVRFLRTMLSGEELPLSAEERRAWLIAYILRAGAAMSFEDHKHLVNLESNSATIEEAWGVAIDAKLSKTSPMRAIQALLPAPNAGNAPEEDEDAWDIDPLDKPLEWSNTKHHDSTFSVALLALPLHGHLLPADAEAALLELARKQSWFGIGPRTKIANPERTWFVLNAWAGRVEAVLPPLVAGIPFTWMCADESPTWPVTLEARWGIPPTPLARARQRAWRNILNTERWTYAVQDRWAIERMKSLDPAPKFDLPYIRDRASARAAQTVKDLAPAWILGRARTWALELSGDANALGEQYIIRDIGRGRTRNLIFSLGLAQRERHARYDGWWKKRCVLSTASFVVAAAINQVLGQPGPRIHRRELATARYAMADPDYLGHDLSDQTDREQARQEWTDFLRSPLSPIPMLDALLATDFTEIDCSTKALTERFEREAEALLLEIGEPIPPAEPDSSPDDRSNS